jgi:protein-disulfide isomerase
MPERNRPTRRLNGKKRPAQRENIFSRYLPLWIFGGTFLVVAIILAVLFLSPSTKTDPLEKSMGPADAKVVVTEYGDYQCPGCKSFTLDIVPKLKTEFIDTGQIRFAFRQMAFIGSESILAAEATECANEQGKFWEYHEKVYQNQGGENVGTYTADSLTTWAGEVGLDTAKFKSCLTSHKYRGKVRQETTTGSNKGVYSTPAVFINDQLVDPGSSYDQIRALIMQAVANAK